MPLTEEDHDSDSPRYAPSLWPESFSGSLPSASPADDAGGRLAFSWGYSTGEIVGIAELRPDPVVEHCETLDAGIVVDDGHSSSPRRH